MMGNRIIQCKSLDQHFVTLRYDDLFHHMGSEGLQMIDGLRSAHQGAFMLGSVVNDLLHCLLTLSRLS